MSERIRLTYGSKKMNEYEKQVVHKMIRSLETLFDYDPNVWRKTRNADGKVCLVVTDSCADDDERIVEGISDGFEWMGFDTDYTKSEMALLSIGFDYRWGDDVHIMANNFDVGIMYVPQSFKDARRVFCGYD